MNFIRDIADRYKIEEDGRKLGELLAANPAFKETIEEIERHWLEKANTILSEILTEIRVRISSPETTMGDLVRAIDVISDKYNLHLGKPTSFNASANLNITQNLSDEELDKKIKDIEAQFLSAPQTTQLLHPQHTPLTATHSKESCAPSLEDGTPPQPSSLTACSSSSVEGGDLPRGRRKVTIREVVEEDDEFRPPDDQIRLFA